MFQIDNPFWQGVGKVVQCVQVSALWLLFCIPVFTIGPATAAMYYTVHKVLRGGRSYVWTEFWSAFKDNFKKGTAAGLLTLLLEAFLIADCVIFRKLNANGNPLGSLYWLTLILACVAACWGMYVMCYMARFDVPLKRILINPFVFMVLHFWKTVEMFLFLVGGLAVVYVMPMLILVVPAAVTWLASLVLEKVFYCYMSEEDRRLEDENRQ